MKLPPYIPAEFEGNALNFDYEDFRKDIVANGHSLWWEYGMPCPCREKIAVGTRGTVIHTHATRGQCANCGGTGVYYVEGQSSVGIISGYGEKGVVSQYMLRLQPGEMFLSLLPEHVVDMEDRFTDLSITRPMSEIRQREASAILELRYPIAKKVMKLGASHDASIPVRREVGVAYMSKASSVGVYTGGPFIEYTHFAITEGGRLDYSLSDANPLLGGPAEGEWVAVRYYAHPVYKVKEIVRQGRDLRTYTNEDGCSAEDIGLGPTFVILSPEYKGFRDPPNTPFNVETDEE